MEIRQSDETSAGLRLIYGCFGSLAAYYKEEAAHALKGFVIQGILERIARTLNQFNVNNAHKPVNTVGSIKKSP